MYVGQTLAFSQLSLGNHMLFSENRYSIIHVRICSYPPIDLSVLIFSTYKHLYLYPAMSILTTKLIYKLEDIFVSIT